MIRDVLLTQIVHDGLAHIADSLGGGAGAGQVPGRGEGGQGQHQREQHWSWSAQQETGDIGHWGWHMKTLGYCLHSAF